MTNAKYRFSLDIHDAAAQVALVCKWNDTAVKLYINLTDGGSPYQIADGCFAEFKAQKPDNTILRNYCTIEHGAVCYQFTEQTSNVPGKVDCEIRLYGPDGDLLTSPAFILMVSTTVAEDDEIPSSDEVTTLTELIARAHTLIQELEATREDGGFNGTDGTPCTHSWSGSVLTITSASGTCTFTSDAHTTAALSPTGATAVLNPYAYIGYVGTRCWLGKLLWGGQYDLYMLYNAAGIYPASPTAEYTIDGTVYKGVFNKLIVPVESA